MEGNNGKMQDLLIAEGRRAFLDIRCENAAEQSLYAAGELQYYLGMMTGGVFEIRKNDPDEKTPAIRLEQGDFPELGDDGFQLESGENGLRIRGGKRGILYGVYEFLEKCGCRFFTPLDEKIPCHEKLTLPALHETQVPVLEYRFHNTRDLTHFHRFSVKCRINGGSVPEKFGGSKKYAWFVHTMNNLVPQELYGKSHPEYFSMVDGKRFVPDNPHLAQRCLTNPDVLKISIENTRKALREHPDCELISISQLDNGYACTCEKCRESDAREGSPAGTMLKFVNAIADALRDEFPRVVFDTLAYQYTRPAPLHVRPSPNVCVRLCSIECCFAHPMETCDDATRGVEHPDGTRSDFLTDLRNWGKVSNRLYIWDYVTCFSHYPTPHPNWHTLQPNLQAFVKNHVKGVFEQGNSKLGGGPDLVELRQYLLSKLLWDPFCDLERHMTEFLEYYYGSAAPQVREYLEAICRKCEKDDIHVGFNDAPVKDFVSEEMLAQYEEILRRAEQAVKDDPMRWIRIKKIELCPEYLRLKRKSMLRGELDPKELNDFFTRWRAYGFTRIHEWVSAELSHQAFLRGKWRGEELLEHWTAGGPEEL